MVWFGHARPSHNHCTGAPRPNGDQKQNGSACALLVETPELLRQAPELLTMRPQRMKTHPEEGSQALDVLLLTPELLFHSPSARG